MEPKRLFLSLILATTLAGLATTQIEPQPPNLKRDNAKAYIAKLQQKYNLECQGLHPSHYNTSDYHIAQYNLSQFLGFMRNDAAISTTEFVEIPRLSLLGTFLMLFPITLISTASLCFIMCSLFFFFPAVFSRITAFFNPLYTVEEPGTKRSVRDWLFFRLVKDEFWNGCMAILLKSKRVNNKSKMNGILLLFVIKFWICAGLVLVLLVGNNYISRVDQHGDCGFIKASLDLVKGQPGTFFAEFGMYGNNTVIKQFTNELKNFKRDFTKWDPSPIIQRNFSKDYAEFRKAMDDFSDELYPLDEHHRRIHEQFSFDRHFLHLWRKFQDKVSDEINELRRFGMYLREATVSLIKFEYDRTEDLKKFKDSEKAVTEGVQGVIEDFYNAQFHISEYFRNYHKSIFLLGIISIFWVAYAITEFCPTSVRLSSFVPVGVRLVFQLAGAVLMVVLSLSHFLTSQTMIQTCTKGYNSLYNRTLVANYFGRTERMKWVDTCLMKTGDGDFFDLFNKTVQDEFGDNLKIMLGFSENIKKYTHESAMKELKKFQLAFKQAKHLSGRYKLQRDPEDNTKEPVIKQRLREGLKELNTLVNCTGNLFVANKHRCKLRKLQNRLGLTEFNTQAVCIQIDKSNLTTLEGRYTGTCVGKENENKVDVLYLRLRKWLKMYEEHCDDAEHSFNILVHKIWMFHNHLRKCAKPYNWVRNEFKESILRLERVGHNPKKAFDCSGLSDLAKQALSGACYRKTYTYETAYIAFCFCAAGYLLFILTILGFLEFLLDKAELKKYEELTVKNAGEEGEEKIELT